MTLEQQQDELIRIWLEGQPEDVRRRVAALPPLEDGPSHEVGASDDAATWERAGAAEWADPAAWCDSHIERLQDEFDLTLGQALGIAEWGRGMVRRALEGSEGHMLTRVLTRLLQNKIADVRVMLWALAFQTGVARRMVSMSPSQMATELGVTRALMSHWMGEWESLLGFRDGTYAKSKDARENMRRARLRVLERRAEGAASDSVTAEAVQAGSEETTFAAGAADTTTTTTKG
jgi:hypothetical protein